MEFAVFSRRTYTGTIADLPYSARLAWGIVLFEADKLRGRAKLPVRDLANWARITLPEAAEAIRLFLEPDPYSSSKAEGGRRLRAVDGEEDWYEVVTWEKHREEREVFFNRLRQQRFKAKQREVTVSNANKRPVTKEPEPEPEPEPKEESNTLFAIAHSNDSSKKKRPKESKLSAKELVESFSLEEKHREWGKKNAPSVPLEVEIEAWKDRCRQAEYRNSAGKGGLISDAQASFYTACRNAERYGTYQKGAGLGKGGWGQALRDATRVIKRAPMAGDE